MKISRFPIRYLPKNLTKKDVVLQRKLLEKSKRLYRKGQFYTRKRNIKSFKTKPSKHLRTVKKIYGIEPLNPEDPILAKKTGCSLESLQKIVNKGEGAYYSSGSRPNQTPQSWGIARLASSITGQKAAAVDYNILEEGCNHRKRAFMLAKTAKKKYGYGHGSAKHSSTFSTFRKGGAKFSEK